MFRFLERREHHIDGDIRCIGITDNDGHFEVSAAVLRRFFFLKVIFSIRSQLDSTISFRNCASLSVTDLSDKVSLVLRRREESSG